MRFLNRPITIPLTVVVGVLLWLSYQTVQITCISHASYREAGNQGLEGEKAIGLLAMARAKDPKFPSTPCGVVWQQEPSTQFSFTRNRELFLLPIFEKHFWRITFPLAIDIYRDRYQFPKGWECVRWFERTDFKGTSTEGIKFFKTLRKVGSVEEHSFYCEKEKKEAKHSHRPRA